MARVTFIKPFDDPDDGDVCALLQNIPLVVQHAVLALRLGALHELQGDLLMLTTMAHHVCMIDGTEGPAADPSHPRWNK